jgi:hypothetical protein
MKRTAFIAALLTTLIAASCTQEQLPATDATPRGGRQLTLIGHLSSQTRISIGDKTGNTYPVRWSDGDMLGLFSRTAGADINNVQSLVTAESAGQNSGVFTSDALTLAPTGNTSLRIYYPYSAAVKLAENGNDLIASLPAEQTQSSAGDSRNIGRYGFACATATVAAGELTTNFTLRHTMAYVKFVVSSQELSAYKLKRISLFDRDNRTPLAGSFTANLDEGSLTVDNNASLPYATVTVDTPALLASPQELFLTTYPADFAGKPLYVVVTLEDDALTTVTIPIRIDGKQLKTNAVNVIEVSNLKLTDNSCTWYEPVETRLLAGNGWAYGESNCLLTNISGEGVNSVISVKARGNFMQVEEPMFARTIFNCDLNNDHKMVGVNSSSSLMSPVADVYTITVNAYKVDGGYDGGCGQVAIYGADGETVLWSFTVWMTPPPAEQAYGNTGYVVLDRNLGTYTVEDNWKTNGCYFQWGRPTPFGWGAKGYYSMPTEATDMRFAIENPRYLLYTAGVANTKSDWYLGAWSGARTDRKDDFWGNPNEGNTHTTGGDGHKSIYDPCPKGYRIVSPALLAEVEKNGEYLVRNSTATLRYCYNGTNYAYWPLAGCRWGSNPADRAANNSKTSACYWSNSTATSYNNDADQGGRSLFYKAADGSYTYSSGRAHAFSVRCMKDTENR